MEKTMLNPIQLQLLMMFQYEKDEKNLEEMRDVLLNYIRDKVDREVEMAWKEKNMSNKTIQELKNAHFRTSYIRK